MSLLSVLLKERDVEWTRNIAQCAEDFTAIGALQSSGFQLALVDLLVEELELRSRLYLEYWEEQASFDVFFNEQMTRLHSGLKNRFGVSILGNERCAIVQEKYNALLLSKHSAPPKPSIGFNCT